MGLKQFKNTGSTQGEIVIEIGEIEFQFFIRPGDEFSIKSPEDKDVTFRGISTKAEDELQISMKSQKK